MTLPGRCRGCGLLAIGWVGRLGAICRLSCIRGLRCGDCSGGGVISTSAIALDRLAVCLRGSWSGITYNKRHLGQLLCPLGQSESFAFITKTTVTCPTLKHHKIEFLYSCRKSSNKGVFKWFLLHYLLIFY